jgi:hypothetical protein
METKFRTEDPTHLSNLEAQRLSFKGRDEFSLLKIT